MRLIDADALAKFIDYGHLNNPDEKHYSENDIREMIDMMPTVDALPVIRCRDCKYKLTCEEYIITQQEDAYCSWAVRAERKEECSR